MAAWQKTYPSQKIKVLTTHLKEVAQGATVADAINEREVARMIERSNSSDDLKKLLMAAYKFKVAMDGIKQIILKDL